MESIYEVVTCGQLRAAISEGEIQYSRGIKLSADRVLGARLNLRNLQDERSRRLKAYTQSYIVMSANSRELNERELSPVGTEKFQILLNDSSAQRQLNKLLLLSNYEITRILEQIGSLLDHETDHDQDMLPSFTQSKLHLMFALSAIQDLISWGSDIEVIESQLWLTKTKELINKDENSGQLRGAMTSLKSSAISYFAPISPKEALKMLCEGELRLELVVPKNLESSNVFRYGVTTWSMPYRGREGRSARFIVWIRNRGTEFPLGIMEVGDDAPYSPLRDQALGFSVPNQHDPLNAKLKVRLLELRKTMNRSDLPIDPTLDTKDFLTAWRSLNLDEKSVRDKFTDPSVRKRISYLNRIFNGELALSEADLWNEKDVAAAVRAIKDVTLNRVHTEVVICGALPPFGNLLGGKIVAMMMNHPLVRATLDRDIGVLLAGSFDVLKIENWLPRFGPLLTTTKGLFPNHSAQYNRVRLPSGKSTLKLEKLGLTQGQTMSHISDRSMNFAVEINERMGEKGISREYGSGGAKRQRILQSAARIVGLDTDSLYAHVTRPVYGTLFVSNSQGVVLGGESPEWKDNYMPNQTTEEYETLVMEMWRDKWLSNAKRRVLNSGDTND
jgi:hypothetical protein